MAIDINGEAESVEILQNELRETRGPISRIGIRIGAGAAEVIGIDGARIAWALDHYAGEGLREHHWFVPGVRRYHRTLATLLNGLIDAGLAIERVVESTPSDAWLRDRPQDADERRRPMFLLIRARKA